MGLLRLCNAEFLHGLLCAGIYGIHGDVVNPATGSGIPEKDEAAIRKILEKYPDVDTALERTSLETGAMAYFAWVVGMLVGGALTLLLTTYLTGPLMGIPIFLVWLLIGMVIGVKTAMASRAGSTLAIARVSPEYREKLEALMSREGMKIGMGWMAAFAAGFVLAAVVGQLVPAFFPIPLAVQFAVGLGNLLMARSEHITSREPLVVGAALLATLPGTLFAELYYSYSGFAVFSIVVMLSYLWAGCRLRSRLATVEVPND